MQEMNLIEQAIDKCQQGMRHLEIKRAIEALLFSSSEPISVDKLKEVISSLQPVSLAEVEEQIQQLGREYQEAQRAFQIDRIAGGFQLRSAKEMQPYIERLHQDRRGEKLSTAATEVLAIIAFKGPITRREIESLRGVDCTATVAALTERGLIEPVGRKESCGRPWLFGVTKQFLSHFGLDSLKQLNSL